MNININLNTMNPANPFAATQRFGKTGGLKSTQDKMERRQKAQSQISFFEQQKDNLKNMECDSLEAISRKLDMLHSYEDQITAVKQAYNNEQVWHVLDEAKELGEKIAKQAEKYKPKTAEERKEEMVEEALGTDEEKSAMTETLEEMQEELSEISEEALEEMQEELSEISEEALEEMQKELSEVSEETLEQGVINEAALRRTEDALRNYVPIDMKV